MAISIPVAIGYLLFLATGSGVVALTFQIVHNRYFHPLAKFPGPFWASVTRLWIAYQHSKQNEVAAVTQLHKKYGPIVRITPTMLSVNDATKLPVIYQRQFPKSRFYIRGTFGDVESIFHMRDAAKHARVRRVAAAPYTPANVRRMEPLVDRHVGAWIARLADTFAGSGEVFDFAPWAVYMAFDLVGDIAFGQSFGFVEKGEDAGGLIKGLIADLPSFGFMCRMYPLTEWIQSNWLCQKLILEKVKRGTLGIVMKVRDELLEKRLEDVKTGKKLERYDLLQGYFETRDDEGKSLSLSQIKAELLIVMIAGADPFGAAFLALLLHLLGRPDAHDKVVAEIERAIRAGHLPAAGSGSVPQHDAIAAHCPYYVACVRETLRLTPPAPNFFPRVVTGTTQEAGVSGGGGGGGGLELFPGVFVPEGTELTANPGIVQRDPALYGEDADEFRPERWLEDEEKTRAFLKYNFTFGYGTRVCMGRDLAMMELYKVPLMFLRDFRVTLAGHDARRVTFGGVSHYEDFMISIEKR